MITPSYRRLPSLTATDYEWIYKPWGKFFLHIEFRMAPNATFKLSYENESQDDRQSVRQYVRMQLFIVGIKMLVNCYTDS